MDELDVKIIRELLQPIAFVTTREGQKESLRSIGRKLRVSDGVVAKRAARLVRSGFIKGFPLLLNPGLLGLKVGALILEVKASTPTKELAKRLSLIDGLFVVQSYYSSSVGITFYYGDDESFEKKAELISTVAGALGRKLARIPFPTSTVSLSKTDWRIISRLQRNVDEPLKAIAEELQISTRTVRRRMVGMTKGGVIFTIASMDVTAVREGIVADLIVEYDNPLLRPRVDLTLIELLDPYYYFTGLWEGFSSFAIIVPSISKSREIVETVRKVEGIKSADVELVEDRHEFYGYLHEAVERKLASLQLNSS
jgi:DNA-binding Lrp family transcriptional regulator